MLLLVLFLQIQVLPTWKRVHDLHSRSMIYLLTLIKFWHINDVLMSLSCPLHAYNLQYAILQPVYFGCLEPNGWKKFASEVIYLEERKSLVGKIHSLRLEGCMLNLNILQWHLVIRFIHRLLVFNFLQNEPNFLYHILTISIEYLENQLFGIVSQHVQI